MKPDFSELDHLIEQLRSDDLSDAEQNRLVELLEGNSEAQRRFAQQMALSAALRYRSLTVGEHSTTLAGVRSRRRSYKIPIIASILATTAVVVLAFLGLNNFRSVDDSSPPVGWVSDVAGVIWDDGQEPYPVGASFGTGQIRVLEGQLVLQFKSGATLTCDGPSTVDVLSDMRLRVARGKIRVRIAESAKGFVVETPDAEVVDLGTEFGVSVRNGEHTDVVVFDGEVDVQRKTAKAEGRRRLTRGEAVRVDNHGDMQRIVQVNRKPKTDSWSTGETDSEDSVIRSIRDNLRDPGNKKYYEIVPGGFDEDVLAYVNRRHQWNGLTKDGLPKFLRGGDYVKTFGSDRNESGLEIVVEVKGPTMLYILYDDRCPVPPWLSEKFTDTDVDVGKDNSGKIRQEGVGPGNSVDNVVSVWQRFIDDAGEIVLGPVGEIRREEQAMYGIVAVPTDK